MRLFVFPSLTQACLQSACIKMALQKIDKFLGVEESLGMSSQYYSEHLKKHNLPHEKIFLLLLLHNLTFRICAVYHSFALCHLQRQWQKAAELPILTGPPSLVSGSTAEAIHPPTSGSSALDHGALSCAASCLCAATLHARLQ